MLECNGWYKLLLAFNLFCDLDISPQLSGSYFHHGKKNMAKSSVSIINYI